jgi:diacylglycerol kinase family enzyme
VSPGATPETGIGPEPTARSPQTPASRDPIQAPEDFEPFAPALKKRMLIIVNPYATTVSDRLRHLVVYALQGRYEVDAVDTEERGHAIELCREAAHEGYDVVVAFGGDGTVNEAANGLRGSPTPLTCLPGGSANVYGKILGIPGELVDATEHLLAMADDWRPRRVDLGVVNGRCFTFASGLGLDASVVKRVDSNPHLKARFGAYYFTWAAVSTFTRRYILKPPHLAVDLQGERYTGVTAIIQNGSPFTYFKDRPIEVADASELDSGTLQTSVLRRARPHDMPSIAFRAFSRRARVTRHRQVIPLAETVELTVSSSDGQPLPLQVDGDYLGDTLEARYSVLPQALSVIS